MKAVRFMLTAVPICLNIDAPIPEILPDEVLIRVYAASVNPVDWKIREGMRKTTVPSVFPLTLGWDVSGASKKQEA